MQFTRANNRPGEDMTREPSPCHIGLHEVSIRSPGKGYGIIDLKGRYFKTG